MVLTALSSQAAAQFRIPVTILEHNDRACHDALARSGRSRVRDYWCLRGVAQYRPGIAEIRVNGAAAVLQPDSSGGTLFVGFADRDSITQVVAVTLRGADGNVSEEQFRLTAETDPSHPEGQPFAMTNLHPRTLGDGGAWTPAPRSVLPPALATGTISVAPPGAAVPAAAAPPGGAQVPVDPGPAVVEDPARQYIRVTEPQEWSGVGTRGISTPGRRSVRVVGYATHPSGVASVEIDGQVASLSRDRGGEYRFSGYVSADSVSRDVTVLVRGQTGLPVVGHYTLNVTPARSTFTDRSQAWPAGSVRRRWAVVVGISAYQDTSIRSLRFADADAKSFYDFLRSPQAGAGGFPEDHVKLLLNEEATYARVREALFGFLRQSTPDDEVVIYFAGHGAADPLRESDLYLLTYDTRGSAVSSTALPMREMERAVEDLFAKHIVLITDACHSGGIAPRFANRGAGEGNRINDAFVRQLNSTTGGLAVFNASEADQSSAEDVRWGGGHGVFTWYLLQGLRGDADEDGDHIVTLVELMQWTVDRVRRERSNAQIPSVGNQSYDHSLPMSLVLDSAELAAVPAPAPPMVSPVTTGAPGAPVMTPGGGALPAALADSLAKAREAVGIFSNSAQYRSNLGRLLLRALMNDEAILAFREAVRLDPQSATFKFDLAQALAQAGRSEEAAAAFDAAIDRDGNNAEFYAGYGASLMQAGKYDLGVEKLRRAVRMQPSSASYQAMLGRALRAAQRPRDAALALRLAVGIDRTNVAYHRELAVALTDDARSQEAVAVLRDAIRMAPDTADLQYRLGELLRSSGDLNGARAAFTAALHVDSAAASFHSALGQVLRDLGLQYEAILEFRAVSRIAPEDAAAQYQLGTLFAGSEQGDSALVHLREAVRLGAGNAEYHNGLGQALRKKAQPVEALQELIQAVRLEGTRARYHYDVAMMYLETGNNGDALAALRQAATLDPTNREYATELRNLQHRMPR
ncbi:MAG TPA: tetratricopeptide repeat protein [Longimicrobiaceae bacterium]|nr:tetratricopeptide repeat protein [Longimicrobiaceae bacterium]